MLAPLQYKLIVIGNGKGFVLIYFFFVPSIFKSGDRSNTPNFHRTSETSKFGKVNILIELS